MKILFMGRKAVAARVLENIHATRGVEVVGVLTDSHLDGSATTKVAERLNLPVLTFEDALRRAEAGDLDFNLGVSILYWRRLKGPLLTVPGFGVINFHPAPLPEYKGVGGYNLGILDGLSEWAVSAHYVDETIDTGPIVSVDRFPIDPIQETAQSLERKSMERLYVLASKVWEDFIAEPRMLPTTPNLGGRHLSRRELEAMKRIDPNTDDVARKARAFWFPPYDGAYVEIDGEKFTLVDRTILEGLADPAASSLFSPSSHRPS